MDSGVCVVAEQAGEVERSTSTEIIIRHEDGTKKTYKLTKFLRSNQSNCYNQRPIVEKGEHVEEGQVIADGPSTSNGEMALGKNPLIAVSYTHLDVYKRQVPCSSSKTEQEVL